MTEPLSFVTAIFLGLFGASHCLVMCGGIAAAAGQADPHHRLRGALLFNIGRVSSYTLAGLIVGALGLWLADLHTQIGLVLRSIAGLMLMLMGLYVARWAMWLTRIEHLGRGIWSIAQPVAQKRMGRSDPLSQWLLGALWGWLPCGLIYSTLSWVAASADPLNGALAMLGFGLGTLPAIFSASMASVFLMGIINRKSIRVIAGTLLFGYGVFTLISVWQPYLF